MTHSAYNKLNEEERFQELNRNISAISDDKESKKILQMLISEEGANVELAFIILKGNKNILKSFSKEEKNTLKRIVNLSYLKAHLALTYGFKSYVTINGLYDSLFSELAQYLPTLKADNSYENRYKIFEFWVKSLPNIKYIDTRNGHLNKLPDEIYELKQLRKLMICHNPITGFSPKIKQLTKLEAIGFCDMAVGFYLPIEMGELKNTVKDVCIDYGEGEYWKYSGIKSEKALRKLLPKAFEY